MKNVVFLTISLVYFTALFAQDKAFYEKKFIWDKERKILSGDFASIDKPTMDEFAKKVFHFPPVRQDTTGTCWSYSTISFLESEIYRLHKKKIKLSEMFIAYWEYVEKARRFIKEKGNSEFAQGSESDLALERIRQYGIVPLNVYTGLINGKTKHNHGPMFREMRDYLDFIKENAYWDEEVALTTIKSILNKYLGVPPLSFEYEGKKYTPSEFRDNVCQINPDDYVEFLSTLKYDYYTKCEFDVPDNWTHSKNYYNIPLQVFYETIKRAINNGYSMIIGGDVSEAGKYGWEDIAIIVPWDIAQEGINQNSREFRIYNKTTTDDHGIHLVGFTHHNAHDWFLIKDSGSSSHYGKYKGYYFFRDDFIKLKMLCFCVHKDAVKDVLAKFKDSGQ
ncbi:MAG TPA: peptidase C1 [Calditrichaeota bacterium]|nr:peptidase C1 [Calditrichota bacterium]